MVDSVLGVVREVVGSRLPLEQLHAEAMLAVATVMRRQAARLPEGDELAEEFISSARDYSAAALLEWPNVAQVRLVDRPGSD